MREEVLLLAGDDFGNGFAFAADDREIVFIDPQHAIEEPLAGKNLARTDGEQPAIAAIDRLLTFVFDVVEPELVFGHDVWLDVAEVGEILIGHDEVPEAHHGSADEALGAVAGGGEDDFADFAIFAGLGAALVEFLQVNGLRVSVPAAFGGGFAFTMGDPFGEVGGRVFGEERRGDGG